MLAVQLSDLCSRVFLELLGSDPQIPEHPDFLHLELWFRSYDRFRTTVQIVKNSLFLHLIAIVISLWSFGVLSLVKGPLPFISFKYCLILTLSWPNRCTRAGCPGLVTFVGLSGRKLGPEHTRSLLEIDRQSLRRSVRRSSPLRLHLNGVRIEVSSLTTLRGNCICFTLARGVIFMSIRVLSIRKWMCYVMFVCYLWMCDLPPASLHPRRAAGFRRRVQRQAISNNRRCLVLHVGRKTATNGIFSGRSPPVSGGDLPCFIALLVDCYRLRRGSPATSFLSQIFCTPAVNKTSFRLPFSPVPVNG
ncbi:hypothetical protein LXL04_038625 [Taraxacum kok-saghyz]